MKITSGRVCRRYSSACSADLRGVDLQSVAFEHAAQDDAGRARVVDDEGTLGHSARMIVAKVITDDAPAGRQIRRMRVREIPRDRSARRREYAAAGSARAGGWLSMAYSTTDIRNIALVGQAGAGKTLLAESLLAESGAIRSRGSLERGTTVCDFDPQEQQLRHSLDAAIVHFDVGALPRQPDRHAGLSRISPAARSPCSKRWKPPRSSSAPSTASSR